MSDLTSLRNSLALGGRTSPLSGLLVCVLLFCAVTKPLHAAEESACVRQVLQLLPPGTTAQVMTASDDGNFRVDTGTVATASVVAVEKQFFSAAQRVVVKEAVNPPYTVQAYGPPVHGVVHRDDILLVSYWIRAPTAAGGASGTALMRLQLTTAPWSEFTSASTGAELAWRQVFAHGKATKDFADANLGVVWHLGYQTQTIDVGGLVVLNLGKHFDVAKIPVTHVTYPGREPDAAWRVEAAKRIERYRKSDLVVTVHDAQGTPVTGAKVSITQRRLAFGIGSFTGYDLLNKTPDGEQYRQHLSLFNRVTTPIYWADWGWPNKRSEFLALARYAHEQGFTARAHPIIYPGWNYLPSALKADEQDPVALQAKLLAHVREICAATREFGFRDYDVTNELRDLSDLHRLVGRAGVAQWYATARASLPAGTHLAINENTILTDGGGTEANQKIYLEWIRDLEKLGQKPDVIGFQGHFGESLTAPTRVWEILDRFAKTGCELQITEFDLNTLDESVQADYTRDFMTTVFAHPAVSAFTMWGFWEGDIWQHNSALYRKDWSPKPNGVALEALLKSWRTTAAGTTNAQGQCILRGFRGDYDVTIINGALQPWHGTVTLGASTTLPVALP